MSNLKNFLKKQIEKTSVYAKEMVLKKFSGKTIILKKEDLEELSKILKKDYIPKQKVKDKIEELKEHGYWTFYEGIDLDNTINILEELLEDK